MLLSSQKARVPDKRGGQEYIACEKLHVSPELDDVFCPTVVLRAQGPGQSLRKVKLALPLRHGLQRLSKSRTDYQCVVSFTEIVLMTFVTAKHKKRIALIVDFITKVRVTLCSHDFNTYDTRYFLLYKVSIFRVDYRGREDCLLLACLCWQH